MQRLWVRSSPRTTIFIFAHTFMKMFYSHFEKLFFFILFSIYPSHSVPKWLQDLFWTSKSSNGDTIINQEWIYGSVSNFKAIKYRQIQIIAVQFCPGTATFFIQRKSPIALCSNKRQNLHWFSELISYVFYFVI